MKSDLNLESHGTPSRPRRPGGRRYRDLHFVTLGDIAEGMYVRSAHCAFRSQRGVALQEIHGELVAHELRGCIHSASRGAPDLAPDSPSRLLLVRCEGECISNGWQTDMSDAYARMSEPERHGQLPR